MTKIKLCGLRRKEDVLSAAKVGCDYAGFILSKPFSRYIAPETVRELRPLLGSGITAVGVFVNEPISYIVQVVQSGAIDMVQLHGQEDDGYIEALRQEIGCPISKAFKIQTDADIAFAERSKADFVLLDSGTGTGQTFDWNLLREMPRPIFLAGGLNPENVADAIARCHPYCVDVSSGIETDKVKDETKMAAFVAAVRRGEEA